MSKESTITDRRLLAALDYIDQKYIDDVFSILKEPEAASEPEKMTWRTPLKHWRQFAALAACILLLSVASPLVNYIAEVIGDFNAGAGSGTTESLSENTSESDDMFDNTSDTTANTIEQSTDEIETQMPDAIIIPNYLEFDPPLEPISQELMFEIREKWAEKQYEDTYKEYYGLRITAGYSEDEAVRIATEEAEKAAEKAKYTWFVLYALNGPNSPLVWYYRYYGMIGDYVVLSTYIDSGFGAYGGFTVSDYEFAYPNGGTIYLYKDGVFDYFEKAYNEGIITTDQVALIHGRYKKYESVYRDWYRAELEKYYENKGET